MIDDFYEKIYRLRYIVRYSNVPRVTNESVAEHSFFVAAIVMRLYQDYDFNLGIALKIAVAHDVIESVVDDISHEVKGRFPKLAKEIQRAEQEGIIDFPEIFQEGFEEYDDTTIEAKVVHLADAMQCYQYAKNEMTLGNNGYMTTVYTHSLERIEELQRELKEYARNSSNIS